MCGIFALLNSGILLDNGINFMNYRFNNRINFMNYTLKEIQDEFMKGKNRGPESSKFIYNKTMGELILGFHRLAINGLNESSNQPLIFNDITLICNGEIYNYKNLYKEINVIPNTESDCEVIIHLYIKYGIEQTLIMLDGVFSFILFDGRLNNGNLNKKLYIARDPFGVRPLYEYFPNNVSINVIGFASELKCLNFLQYHESYIKQFEPGTYSEYKLSKIDLNWNLEIGKKNVKYFVPSFSHSLELGYCNNISENISISINTYLNYAVEKRCLTTERPIACLLSGGLDSSLISALVAKNLKKNNKPLNTYSIGLKGGTDLKYAKIVADYIESIHTEVIIEEIDMFNAIEEVIYAIESYDTTTVRASLGNYLISKYISKNTDAKVIFNGDGADELFGGYLYMNLCPDNIEFDKETRRLLKDIHLFDVLRSDKSISSNGLEPRTPFLDKSLVNYILSLPPEIRNHNSNKNNINEDNKIEKYLLRKSFIKNYFKDYNGRQILPDKILWRKKEAFSDGVSSTDRSLFIILQEHIASYYYKNTGKIYEANIELEKKYYLEIFNKYFKDCENIVPYYWMPKYTNNSTNDPSARTISIYK